MLGYVMIKLTATLASQWLSYSDIRVNHVNYKNYILFTF